MLTYTKQLPIRDHYDVCVVGGGPAGVTAAIAAARHGARTLLIEALSCSGGLSTAALVPVLMSYSDGDHFLAGGLGQEIFNRGQASGALHGAAIFAEKLKRLYEQMLLEANVTVSYNTTLIDVVMDGTRIDAIVCSAKSGLFAFTATCFVDASGDGDLAALAGAPYSLGDDAGNMMPATLCSLWTNINWEQYRQGGAFSHNDDKMPAILKKAYDEGLLPVDDFHHTGMTRTADGIVTANISHAFGVNPLDERSVTQALIDSRKLHEAYETMYRKYVSGCQDAQIATSGSILGVRESRRITGDYVLCSEDYDRRAVFPDEIGRYNFSIDIHPSTPGAAALEHHKQTYRGRHYAKGESYGIPYRILCPLKTSNLLTAGRCVSTDRPLMASLRVIPGCWITGMAAGTAAALAANDTCHDPHRLDVRKLQQTLCADGAFLPNFS